MKNKKPNSFFKNFILSILSTVLVAVVVIFPLYLYDGEQPLFQNLKDAQLRDCLFFFWCGLLVHLAIASFITGLAND